MINTLLDRLQQVKPRGSNSWTALCPVHNEKTPSLAIRLTDDGKILLHCFGCGAEPGSITAAVGMQLTDLFPESIKDRTNSHKYNRQKRQYFNAESVLVCLRNELTLLSIGLDSMSKRQPIDEDGIEAIDNAITKVLRSIDHCRNKF